MLTRLKQHLQDHNRAAQLQIELDELVIERRYLQQLAYLDEQRIHLKDRIELLFKFRIFRTKPFAEGEARTAVFHALQMYYYDKSLRDKETELRVCRESLARANFTGLLKELTTASMHHLKQHLQLRVPPSNSFDLKTYRRNFDAFVQRFPILAAVRTPSSIRSRPERSSTT